MTKPLVALVQTGKGALPFDVVLGRAAERFGVTPEEIEAGDCCNLRAHELLNLVDEEMAAKQEKER